MTEIHNLLKKLNDLLSFTTPVEQSTERTVTQENTPVMLTEAQQEEHRQYDLMMSRKISEAEFKRRVARIKITHESGIHIPNDGTMGKTGPRNPDGSGGNAEDNR